MHRRSNAAKSLTHHAYTRRMSMLATAALLLALAPAHQTALPFIEDDYGKALAEAKAKNLPLFIEAWAPW